MVAQKHLRARRPDPPKCPLRALSLGGQKKVGYRFAGGVPPPDPLPLGFSGGAPARNQNPIIKMDWWQKGVKGVKRGKGDKGGLGGPAERAGPGSC